MSGESKPPAFLYIVTFVAFAVIALLAIGQLRDNARDNAPSPSPSVVESTR